nr:peptidyl-tRNA hydrolase, mitochondrial [Ipomoea batatas]
MVDAFASKSVGASRWDDSRRSVIAKLYLGKALEELLVKMDPKAFLLQKFNATARERVDVALQEGVDALKQLLSKGLTESASVVSWSIQRSDRCPGNLRRDGVGGQPSVMQEAISAIALVSWARIVAMIRTGVVF